MSYLNPVFDVTMFGAAGDGATLDDGAIAAAVSALQAYSAGNTRGTLYFPDGTYKVSSEIAVALSGEFTCTIKGAGRFSSKILQSGSAANGIHVTLTKTDSKAKCRVEICDLSILTAPGVTAGNAIFVDYYSSATATTEDVNGSVVTRVEINTQNYAGSGGLGGWTTGIKFNNPWKAHIYDVTGSGAPGATGIPTSGAGSNAFIVITGGKNINISHVNAFLWQYGIKLAAGDGASAGLQGLTVTDFEFVGVGIGVHLLPQAGALVSSLIFSAFLIDQGNSTPNAGYANIGFSLDCTGNQSSTVGGQFIITNGNILQVAPSGSVASSALVAGNTYKILTVGTTDFTAVGATSNTVGLIFIATGATTGDGTAQAIYSCFEIKGPCTQCIVSNVVCFTAPQFAHLYTGVTYGVFAGNQLGEAPIAINSGATNNQFNNKQGSTFNNNGGSTNTALDTLF